MDTMDAELYLTGIGQVHRYLPEYVYGNCNAWSVATLDKEMDEWCWHHILADAETIANDINQDMSEMVNKTVYVEHVLPSQRVIPGLQCQPEVHFLAAQARYGAYVTGWDGSPVETQPAFFESSFLQA